VNTDYILEARGLTKQFRGFYAVKNVDLSEVVAELLDSLRPGRAQDLSDNRRTVEGPGGSPMKGIRMGADDRYHGHHCAVVGITTHRDVRELEDLGDLFGHRVEHLGRGRTACHERRHAP